MFVVQCFDQMVLKAEHEADSFPKASSMGRAKRRAGFRVVLKRKSGLKHKEPMAWRWSQNDIDWKPIAWYDEYAAGKRAPKGASGLFEH